MIVYKSNVLSLDIRMVREEVEFLNHNDSLTCIEMISNKKTFQSLLVMLKKINPVLLYSKLICMKLTID